MRPSDLRFEEDGAEMISGAVSRSGMLELAGAFAAIGDGRPGARSQTTNAAIDAVARPDGEMGGVAQRFAKPGETMRAVRIVLFDKTPAMNWAVAWHQDRTIAVAARHDVDGFEHWNRKGGVDHVEPPIELLQRMVTLRLHLDDTDADNGALDVVAGSHRLGRVREADMDEAVAGGPAVCCATCAGDILAMRLTTIHKSERATVPNRRRVLHVDYSADALPLPLRWVLQ